MRGTYTQFDELQRLRLLVGQANNPTISLADLERMLNSIRDPEAAPTRTRPRQPISSTQDLRTLMHEIYAQDSEEVNILSPALELAGDGFLQVAQEVLGRAAVHPRLLLERFYGGIHELKPLEPLRPQIEALETAPRAERVAFFREAYLLGKLTDCRERTSLEETRALVTVLRRVDDPKIYLDILEYITRGTLPQAQRRITGLCAGIRVAQPRSLYTSDRTDAQKLTALAASIGREVSISARTTPRETITAETVSYDTINALVEIGTAYRVARISLEATAQAETAPEGAYYLPKETAAYREELQEMAATCGDHDNYAVVVAAVRAACGISDASIGTPTRPNISTNIEPTNIDPLFAFLDALSQYPAAGASPEKRSATIRAFTRVYSELYAKAAPEAKVALQKRMLEIERLAGNTLLGFLARYALCDCPATGKFLMKEIEELREKTPRLVLAVLTMGPVQRVLIGITARAPLLAEFSWIRAALELPHRQALLEDALELNQKKLAAAQSSPLSPEYLAVEDFCEELQQAVVDYALDHGQLPTDIISFKQISLLLAILREISPSSRALSALVHDWRKYLQLNQQPEDPLAQFTLFTATGIINAVAPELATPAIGPNATDTPAGTKLKIARALLAAAQVQLPDLGYLIVFAATANPAQKEESIRKLQALLESDLPSLEALNLAALKVAGILRNGLFGCLGQALKAAAPQNYGELFPEMAVLLHVARRAHANQEVCQRIIQALKQDSEIWAGITWYIQHDDFEHIATGVAGLVKQAQHIANCASAGSPQKQLYSKENLAATLQPRSQSRSQISTCFGITR
jgi:hypothetical protein